MGLAWGRRDVTRRHPRRHHPQFHPAQLTSTTTIARPRRQPLHQIRPERRGAGGHRRRRSGQLPRPPEHKKTRRAPPSPSLRPRGFAGSRLGDGEAEKGGGGEGRPGRRLPSRPWGERRERIRESSEHIQSIHGGSIYILSH